MKNIDEILVNQAITANFESDPIDLKQMAGYSIQSIWTGTLVASFIVEKSNDKTTWFAEDTQAAGAAPGTKMVEKYPVTYRWVRLRVAFTSGAGDLSATLFAKG